MKRLRLMTRRSLLRLGVLFAVLIVIGVVVHGMMIRMPGESFRGPLPPLTPEQLTLGVELRRDVILLASMVGPRAVDAPEGLAEATGMLQASFETIGFDVERQCFDVAGVECCNLIAEVAGSTAADEIVVIGAHFDSVVEPGLVCPGANDNGTGVAAVLALARRFHGTSPARTLRFVLFVNEEPPWFTTDDMGSLVYARRCAQRNEKIVAMLSLETIGYYSDAPGSQRYPSPVGFFYPSEGNFIAFVGNVGSRRLVRRSITLFREAADFPSEGAALPGGIPGIGWSDHWAFWKYGYEGVMVTDTAPFRYPHYHRVTDTPDKIDYESTARVVGGLHSVVRDLASDSR